MARSISTTRKKVTSLRWTDHPLIDMGLTAVILESGKYAPEEVTEEDWQSVMKTVKRNYVNRNFEKSSGILFTYNAPFTNPSYSKKPEERKKAIDFAFAIATGKSDPLPENCYFFNDRPAWIRAARDQVPLLMGREQINFYATGTSELPLSDIAYGCLLALPLATPIISGKMAILKTDDPELLLEIADKWKGELDREYAKKELSDRKGIRTRITETLDSIFELYTKKKKKVAKTTKNQIVNEKYYGGLSVYHLSNSGNGPGIQIYHYQPFSLKFLKRANMGAYHFAWKAFTGAFWLSPSGKTGGSEPSKEDRPVRKNIVMERMTAGPEEAKTIIQFFLRYARNRAGILSNLRVSDIDLWPNTSSLVELFLMEIYVMKLERIEK